MASVVEVTVIIRRLDTQGQARLQALMDKSNEGELTPSERQELEALVALYEQNMLANSEALLKATRPDLLDSAGEIDRKRATSELRRNRQPKS
jgi:helix-turn-helix protein